jgi:hypothetical protein
VNRLNKRSALYRETRLPANRLQNSTVIFQYEYTDGKGFVTRRGEHGLAGYLTAETERNIPRETRELRERKKVPASGSDHALIEEEDVPRTTSSS